MDRHIIKNGMSCKMRVVQPKSPSWAEKTDWYLNNNDFTPSTLTRKLFRTGASNQLHHPSRYAHCTLSPDPHNASEVPWNLSGRLVNLL
ncbi:hypothetical protein NQZ68_012413 [Dissostichus eleginoides]|nr:hypothetical protein NQZ68_012413 [Dissostichus eleginoides]